MKSRIFTRFTYLVLFIISSLTVSTDRAVSGDNNKDQFSVLSHDSSANHPNQMMLRYLWNLSNKALDKRLDNYEALKTTEQIENYQKAMKAFFLDKLDLPEKTPLNARVVSTESFDDYRLEKIIYESQPGFYVSALLYLPLTDPPYPGVLVLCGHEETGKSGYQEICISLVRNGMAVLCPDPLGQGERRQFLDENGARIYRASSEHMLTGVAPILLGTCIAGYMIWDGIRGIDYLLSRQEIDPQRIGCTGNSGGGNRTSYLMALDDRITAAAPSCFITTTRRKNISPGPGDAEQNIHAQTAYGMDHPDYIIMRAPKPTLILSATRDFVPIEGAWESFRQAKRIYTRFGYPDRVDLIETDDKHGFTKHLRVGAVRWIRRWLMDKDDEVVEREFSLLSPEKLQCTPDGQVLLMPGVKTVFDLNKQKEKMLEKKRSEYHSDAKKPEILEAIRQLNHIRKLDDLPPATAENFGKVERENYLIEKLVLRWEPGIDLPALLFDPEKKSGNLYLYLHDKGKQADAGQGGIIEDLVKRGHTILAIELRGFGETAAKVWRYPDAKEFTGNNVAEYFMAYKLDKSLLSMRTEDILVTARWLIKDRAENQNEKIRVIAIGETGPLALHALALEPEMFDSLDLRKSLISWSDAAKSSLTRGVFNNTVHSALNLYDLPDLHKLIGPEKIVIEDPVNADGSIRK